MEKAPPSGNPEAAIGAARRTAWWLIKRSKSLRRLRREVKKRLLDRPRRVPARLGVSGLLRELDESDSRYVILRWFDDLPLVDDEGDIDILVEDEDTLIFERLLTRSSRRGDVRCDVFSVNGIPGFDYHRFPYYPPKVAESIIRRAVRHPSGARVPSPEDHFLSLAFHALYHKGYGSGLPIDQARGPRGMSPRHDYTSELTALAARVGLSVPITMRDLDEELDRRGWKPPPDMLMKWAVRNQWCRDLVDEVFKELPHFAGLTVGLVREVASDPDSLASMAQEYHKWGFQVLMVRPLTAIEVARAARLIRGGNWGRGTWPKSGGGPAGLIVAVDPTPSPPTLEMEKRHPGVDNGRVFALKQHLRDRWNEQQSEGLRANIMHSSDNAYHALHYLQAISPQDLEVITRTIEGAPEVKSTSREDWSPER